MKTREAARIQSKSSILISRASKNSMLILEALRISVEHALGGNWLPARFLPLTRAGIVIFAGLLFLSLSRSSFSEDLPKEVIALGHAKWKFQTDRKKTSSYACTEAITRSSRQSESAKWRNLDTVFLEVTAIGGREWFSWLGQDGFSTEIASIVGQGLVSNGEFLTAADAALLNSAASIRFEQPDDVSGRPAFRYSFRISTIFSPLRLANERLQATVDEAGRLWIDQQTYDLLQVQTQADNIPPTLAIRSAGSFIKYQRVSLGDVDRDVLLPQLAETRMQFSSGRELRNDVQFAQCRKYQADASLSFAAAPNQLAPPPETVPISTLPAGLRLKMHLKTPLQPGQAVGAQLIAILDSDVTLNGVTVIPKGSKVQGRLRALERYPPGGASYAVSVEFSQIVAAKKRFRFLASLDRFDYVGVQNELSSRRMTRNVQTMVGLLEGWTKQSSFIAPLPGVGSFFIMKPEFIVPEGTAMIWTTLAPPNVKR